MSVLAWAGGTPVISEPGPHFTWPPITPRTAAAVTAQLREAISVYDRSGVIAELEDRLLAYFGSRHAVLTSSGTAAIHSAYVAVGIRPGDEVIVPAYTFAATATPLLHLGAIPVLADSDPTGNVSASDVEARITDRTRALMVTHLWGIPADMENLRPLAERHDLILLEDASHAHGARIGQAKVGTFGHASAFSMNGPKPLSAGEGGFLLTDDDELFHRSLWHGHYNKRCRNEIPSTHPLHHYAVTGMGLKFRIHPLAASIAMDQLDSLDDYLHGRRAIAEHICRHIESLPGLRGPSIREGARPAWYGLPLRYFSEELDGLPVERFHAAARAEGLGELDRPGSTCPLNTLPLFQEPAPMFPDHPHLERIAYRGGHFPVAEQIWQNTLKLPVWHRKEDMPMVDRYLEGLTKVAEHHTDLLG